MKKIGRWIKRFVILCCLGMAVVLGVNFFVVLSQKSYLLNAEEKKDTPQVDCILILGCQVKANGKMSWMLTDRMNEGIALYKAGVADKILVSGDASERAHDEVGHMKSYAIAQGVPEEAILVDGKGYATYDSMQRLRDAYEMNSCIIVTQKYHLYRSLYIAHSLGLEAYGSPAKEVRYRNQTYRDIREVLARDKDMIKCLVK